MVAKRRLFVLFCVFSSVLLCLYTSTADYRNMPYLTNIMPSFITQRMDDEVPRKRMNVLFLISDDMRRQLNLYKSSPSPFQTIPMYTPNLDNLAKRSLVLENAFVQFSYCNPSRASLLTSRRPDTTRVYNNLDYWRNTGGNFTTIPQYFKQHGYLSVGIGKVFHQRRASNNDDRISWTELHPFKYTEKLYYSKTAGNWYQVTEDENQEAPLMDNQNADSAKRCLAELAPDALSGQQPFFMAVGFKKPHMAYICPQKFFQYYSTENYTVLPAGGIENEPYIPVARNVYNLTYINDTWGRLPKETLYHLRRAYFSCISYVDAMVGEILHELENLGLGSNTVIAFTADHGFHLGENGKFGKQTTLDTSTRVPMILRVPGLTDRGIVSTSVVELVDLFPTLVEAAGLGQMAQCPKGNSSSVEACTEGRSVLPLINQPQLELKPGAISQAHGYNGEYYSLRTEKYRLTELVPVQRSADGVIINRNYSNILETELYDLTTDAEERWNKALDEGYQSIRSSLSETLHSLLG